jgi:hypothetical protein
MTQQQKDNPKDPKTSPVGGRLRSQNAADHQPDNVVELAKYDQK